VLKDTGKTDDNSRNLVDKGLLFLGKLIAYAAMRDNKEVTWFPSYGAEMRGGQQFALLLSRPI